ncbi:hypothetical protein ACQRIT_002808 [Beauveria bassiana]
MSAAGTNRPHLACFEDTHSSRPREQPQPQKNSQKKFHAQQHVKFVTQVPTIAMSCHLPSTLSDRGDASTDFEITVGNVKYLLIENQENFLQCADFDSDNGHILVLVYTIGPNDPIEKSALREFQPSTLNRDDVYQPDFASNMVFYGFSEEGFILDPDTLAASILEFAVDAAYASHNGRVVVPSRCYYKPSKDRPLAGARFSVKDNINVAGQKTTLCNRAWTEFISVCDMHLRAYIMALPIEAGQPNYREGPLPLPAYPPRSK